MARGRVIVDESRCKGCMLCISACPQETLVMADGRLNGRGYHPVEYVDPLRNCTGCGLCAVICPDVCITVYRERAPRPAGVGA